MPETNAAAKAGELTEAEYGALYELWTKSPPKVSGDGKGGFFMRRQNEIAMPGSACAAWPQIESETARKMAAWRGKKIRENVCGHCRAPIGNGSAICSSRFRLRRFVLGKRRRGFS